MVQHGLSTLLVFVDYHQILACTSEQYVEELEFDIERTVLVRVECRVRLRWIDGVVEYAPEALQRTALEEVVDQTVGEFLCSRV